MRPLSGSPRAGSGLLGEDDYLSALGVLTAHRVAEHGLPHQWLKARLSKMLLRRQGFCQPPVLHHDEGDTSAFISAFSTIEVSLYVQGPVGRAVHIEGASRVQKRFRFRRARLDGFDGNSHARIGSRASGFSGRRTSPSKIASIVLTILLSSICRCSVQRHSHCTVSCPLGQAASHATVRPGARAEDRKRR